MDEQHASAFLSVRQVAARIGVGEKRAYQLCACGQVPVVRIGRRVLVPKPAFDAWLTRLTEKALAAAEGAEDIRRAS